VCTELGAISLTLPCVASLVRVVWCACVVGLCGRVWSELCEGSLVRGGCLIWPNVVLGLIQLYWASWACVYVCWAIQYRQMDSTPCPSPPRQWARRMHEP